MTLSDLAHPAATFQKPSIGYFFPMPMPPPIMPPCIIM